MNLKGIGVRLHDMTLHDLMYVRPGQVTLEQLAAVACALDGAGMPLIEFGAGIAAGPDSWGVGHAGDELQACLRAVVPRLRQARVAIQLAPGAAAAEQLQIACDWGVSTVCVAVRWLDAALVAPYLRMGRRLGLDVVGVLMSAHDSDVGTLVRQARIMEAEGASCVTLADTDGTMFSADVRLRMQALRQALRAETELGFHGHARIASAVSNSLAAIEGGARHIEGSLTVPGIGHTPLDVLCSTCHRMGVVTGVDAYQLGDIGEGLVQPLVHAIACHDGAARPPAASGSHSAPAIERRRLGPAKRQFA